MERYSKVFGSKWQSQYSEEFKRKVCREYLDGQDGTFAAASVPLVAHIQGIEYA